MPLTLDVIREYCLKKTGKITEEFPFNDETLVFKVHGKVFLVTVMNRYPPELNLKCEPELAIELRDRYEAVRPGYHMNKRHWNTVTLDGRIPSKEILRMIDHSYDRVVQGLKKDIRNRLLRGTNVAK